MGGLSDLVQRRGTGLCTRAAPAQVLSRRILSVHLSIAVLPIVTFPCGGSFRRELASVPKG